MRCPDRSHVAARISGRGRPSSSTRSPTRLEKGHRRRRRDLADLPIILSRQLDLACSFFPHFLHRRNLTRPDRYGRVGTRNPEAPQALGFCGCARSRGEHPLVAGLESNAKFSVLFINRLGRQEGLIPPHFPPHFRSLGEKIRTTVFRTASIFVENLVSINPRFE